MPLIFLIVAGSAAPRSGFHRSGIFVYSLKDAHTPDLWGRSVMKWAGMYLFGFVIVVGGILAALWKLGVLERIGTAWTLIGLAILIGIGIMISVANSGRKDNIEIDSK
jgi:hypothetical protein